MKNERMHCMEVWGGNQAAEQCLQTTGLNIWIYSRPYGEAEGGGDVYYVSSCASGRITRILLADVAGHGAPAANLAVNLRDLMRKNVNWVRQARFVKSMNQQFESASAGDSFATAVVSTFYAPTRQLTLSNAGHPPPLAHRRETSQWTELVVDRKAGADMPLGVTGQTSYGQVTTTLEPGDLVLCYSDAVMESKDKDGQMLGQEEVLNLVRSLDVRQPNELIPCLVEKLKGLCETNLQHDDVTILLCEATGALPTVKDNLLAPFRLLSPVNDRSSLTSDDA